MTSRERRNYLYGEISATDTHVERAQEQIIDLESRVDDLDTDLRGE